MKTFFGTEATSVDATRNQVPIKGSYSGKVEWNNGAPLFSGMGVAPHLGKSTYEGNIVINTGSVDSAGNVRDEQYATLKFANGDAFKIVSHDLACPKGPGQYQGGGNWEAIEGSGTGRFSGITGGGTFDCHSDYNKGVFDLEMTGAISVPRGN